MIIFALFSRTPWGVLSDKGNIVFLTLEYYITCCYAPVNWYVKQFSVYTDFLASTCRLKLYDGGRKLLNIITCLRFLASSTGDMTTTTAQDNGKMVRFIKRHETQAKEITLLGQIQKEIGWNFPSFNVTMSLLGLACLHHRRRHRHHHREALSLLFAARPAFHHLIPFSISVNDYCNWALGEHLFFLRHFFLSLTFSCVQRIVVVDTLTMASNYFM